MDLFHDDDDDSPPVAKMPHVKDALTVTKKQVAAADWHSFKPMYFVVTYKDSATMMEHVVVVIIAPLCVFHGDLLSSVSRLRKMARSSSYHNSGQPIPWTWKWCITTWRISLGSCPRH